MTNVLLDIREGISLASEADVSEDKEDLGEQSGLLRPGEVKLMISKSDSTSASVEPSVSDLSTTNDRDESELYRDEDVSWLARLPPSTINLSKSRSFLMTRARPFLAHLSS